MRHKYSKKKKLLLLSIASTIAFVAFFASLAYFQSDLTQWQKQQTISFENDTGSTKFKTYVDSLSVGGVAFLITIIAGVIYAKKNKR